MKLDEFLDRDEQILWTGSPARGLIFRPADIFFIPFSLMWIGIVTVAIMVIINDASTLSEADNVQNADAELVMASLIFVLMALVGLFMLFGRFLVDMALRANTFYAITNNRAVIVSGIFEKSFDFRPLEENLQLKVSGSGRGSIQFGDGYKSPASERGFRAWIGPPHPFMFEKINDVSQVYEIVQNAQQNRT